MRGQKQGRGLGRERRRKRGRGRGEGAETGTGAGTRTERRVEGRESLGTSEVIKEVNPKMRERGRRQQVTNSHSHKHRRPSETVASCGGPEPKSGYGEGGRGAKKRKKTNKSYRCNVKNGGRLGREEK